MDETYNILMDYSQLINSIDDVLNVLNDDTSYSTNVVKLAMEALINEHSKISNNYYEKYFKSKGDNRD